MAMALIPGDLVGNVRPWLYRRAGFRKISTQVYLLGSLDLRGRTGIYENLEIGPGTMINAPCLIDLHAPVRIGSHVAIGHHTVIVTSNHREGPASQRCGQLDPAPVWIGDGAWVAAGVTLLPGVVVGAGAIVTAGSVVTKSVPAQAKVAGNPARVIGWLEGAPSGPPTEA
jgi:maltose O-acetyltransferase